MRTEFLVSTLAAAVAQAHFVLQTPTSIGFDDANETVGPCGNFPATDRSKGVTDWSVNGDNIGVLSTHSSVTWEIKAALLSDPTNFLPLVNQFGQKGVGQVCIKGIPGFAAWVGKDAILQVIQHASDGALYQCAAIKFVAGGPDSVPGDCTNSAGVTIDALVPAPGPTSPTTSTSQPPASSTTGGASSSTGGSGSSATTTSPGTTSGATTTTPPSSTKGGANSTATTTSKPPVVTAGAAISTIHGAIVGGMALLAAVLLG